MAAARSTSFWDYVTSQTLYRCCSLLLIPCLDPVDKRHYSCSRGRVVPTKIDAVPSPFRLMAVTILVLSSANTVHSIKPWEHRQHLWSVLYLVTGITTSTSTTTATATRRLVKLLPMIRPTHLSKSTDSQMLLFPWITARYSPWSTNCSKPISLQ